MSFSAAQKQLEYMLPPELGSLLTIAAISYGIYGILVTCRSIVVFNEIRYALAKDQWIWLGALSRSVKQLRHLTRPHLERVLQAAHQEPTLEMDTLHVAVEILSAQVSDSLEEIHVVFAEDENCGKIEFYLGEVTSATQEASVSALIKQIIKGDLQTHGNAILGESNTSAQNSKDASTHTFSASPEELLVYCDSSGCSGSRNHRRIDLKLSSGSQQQLPNKPTRFVLYVRGTETHAHQVIVFEKHDTAQKKLQVKFEWAIPFRGMDQYLLREVYGNEEENIGEEATTEHSECVICFENENNLILLPCRHKCVCSTCYAHIDKCPSCRSKIRGYVVVKFD